MLKKLVIPFFVLTVSAVGCGSSSNNSPDATGKAGSTATAGTHGSAGTSGAGTDGAAGSTAAAGTSGSAGTAAAGTSGSAGTSGAAGTTGGAGTTGAAGHDGGTDAAAGTMGTDAGAGHGGGNPDSGSDAAAHVCSTTSSAATEKLSASDFCTLFLSNMGCENVTGYTIPEMIKMQQSCETHYTSSTKQACQSYHLCGNAYGKVTMDKVTHCPHAAGIGPASVAGPCAQQ